MKSRLVRVLQKQVQALIAYPARSPGSGLDIDERFAPRAQPRRHAPIG